MRQEKAFEAIFLKHCGKIQLGHYLLSSDSCRIEYGCALLVDHHLIIFYYNFVFAVYAAYTFI